MRKRKRERVCCSQLGNRVADRRAHAGGVKRADAADALGDVESKLFVEVFDHVVLDIVAAVSGEAVDAIAIADGFQGIDHQHHRFFFDVDNAPL